ncbi:MAG: CDP-alcohol phosphatidyltransferase family protein [Deltaproteobacteria bacterium]|nr:CDP-alcohol phosphatidyltransferase family protein [Deltaproteobacteria bacterium]
MDPTRLRRIRNYQNTEFFPALFLRPASILITIVIGDWAWVTPNRVTLFATLLKFAAAGMFLVDDRCWLVGGAITLLLGAVFDHVDGTLARYRKTPSNLGFFYDTVSDAVTWFTTLAALGWTAYQRTDCVHLIVVAGAGAYALMVNGYTRSVVETATERAKAKAAAAAAPDLFREEGAPPPERTQAEWLAWVGRCVGQIWKFQEMDLFFWVTVFVVIDRLPELLWLVAITQVAALAIRFFLRSFEMARFDLP